MPCIQASLCSWKDTPGVVALHESLYSVRCTLYSTSTQAWSNGQPNGSVGLHPPGQISIVCVARESRCWSVYPQVCLLWAGKILPKKEKTKMYRVLRIGTKIQEFQKWPKINGISALHQGPQHPSTRRPFHSVLPASRPFARGRGDYVSSSARRLIRISKASCQKHSTFHIPLPTSHQLDTEGGGSIPV